MNISEYIFRISGRSQHVTQRVFEMEDDDFLPVAWEVKNNYTQ